MLYECLVGFPPFDGADGYSIGYKHVHEAPVSLHDVDSRVPKTLANIAMKCLLKDAAARYQTGRELADALLEWLHEVNARSPERVRMVRAREEDRDAKQESKPTTA
jgi:serine/threonine-protein kinase